MPAVVALLGAYFIFDLQMPNECPGALYFLQEFVLNLPVKRAQKYSTYVNACMGIFLNKEISSYT